jgi:PhnB protein
MAVKPIPDGYHTITPYIIVKDAKAALAFYAKAFGAKEILRMPMPDGSIAHAEFKIGDSPIMIGEENEQWGAKSPTSLGGTPFGLCIYVTDCDASFKQAVDAGAKVERPVIDQFYGDRSGTVVDPFGHKWTISTHKIDMTPAEMQKAMEEWIKKMPACT